MKKLIPLLLLIAIFSSCVTKTHVLIEANVAGAEVYVDGDFAGETPVAMDVSNLSWRDQEVIIVAEGYKDVEKKMKKEIKVLNLVSSIVMGVTGIGLIPLLWVYGPDEYQYFEMIPQN